MRTLTDEHYSSIAISSKAIYASWYIPYSHQTHAYNDDGNRQQVGELLARHIHIFVYFEKSLKDEEKNKSFFPANFWWIAAAHSDFIYIYYIFYCMLLTYASGETSDSMRTS